VDAIELCIAPGFGVVEDIKSEWLWSSFAANNTIELMRTGKTECERFVCFR
jgi:hypothetical protein